MFMENLARQHECSRRFMAALMALFALDVVIVAAPGARAAQAQVGLGTADGLHRLPSTR
jgi:hypothetical protein